MNEGISKIVIFEGSFLDSVLLTDPEWSLRSEFAVHYPFEVAFHPS